jgi:L-amino acid N-acyltransferase YncA
MFGYAMMAIAPSFESADVVAARDVSICASPDVPGLGLKLARAAIEGLRERGVSEVVYRVGAAQGKLGALYRRLGAAQCGEEYLLRLN